MQQITSNATQTTVTKEGDCALHLSEPAANTCLTSASKLQAGRQVTAEHSKSIWEFAKRVQGVTRPISDTVHKTGLHLASKSLLAGPLFTSMSKLSRLISRFSAMPRINFPTVESENLDIPRLAPRRARDRDQDERFENDSRSLGDLARKIELLRDEVRQGREAAARSAHRSRTEARLKEQRMKRSAWWKCLVNGILKVILSVAASALLA